MLMKWWIDFAIEMPRLSPISFLKGISERYIFVVSSCVIRWYLGKTFEFLIMSNYFKHWENSSWFMTKTSQCNVFHISEWGKTCSIEIFYFFCFVWGEPVSIPRQNQGMYLGPRHLGKIEKDNAQDTWSTPDVWKNYRHCDLSKKSEEMRVALREQCPGQVELFENPETSVQLLETATIWSAASNPGMDRRPPAWGRQPPEMVRVVMKNEWPPQEPFRWTTIFL